LDSAVCREHLEKLLIEEASVLERLQSVLEHEHALLVANDIEGLERAGETREAYVGELLRIDDERRSLCRMMNLPTDVSGLERLLEWCDSSGLLKERWAECAARATACRAANDRNGALVTARIKKVEGMLDMITGAGNDPKIYDKQGACERVTRGARVSVAV